MQVGLCLYSSASGALLIFKCNLKEFFGVIAYFTCKVDRKVKREHHLVDRALGQALAECKWG